MADSATKFPARKEVKPVAPTDRWWPLDNLRTEIDRVFADFGGSGIFGNAFERMPAVLARGVPAVDLVESDKAFELSAELPGVDAKDIDVSLADGTLTIKGEKSDAGERKDTGYHMSERSYGSFLRSIELPRGIDGEKIEASFSNGVLKITLPKTVERQKNDRKIAVKVA